MSAVAMAPAARRGELIAIATVGAAHFGSHVMQLSIAPLLTLIRDDFDVSYTLLSWVIAAFYAASGLGQVISGFIVDRLGGFRMLRFGMLLQAGAVLAMAAVSEAWMLFPLAVLAGIGNSVYHPADMSILNKRVSQKLIGRAIATHVIAGSIGFAAGPLVGGLIGTAYGWRVGVLAAGVIGLTMALIVISKRQHLLTPTTAAHATGAARSSFMVLLTMPSLLMAFLFFIMASVTGNALNNYTTSALHEGFGAEIVLATILAGAVLVASAIGTLISGVLIDRGLSHHRLGLIGIVVAGFLFMLAAIGSLPLAVIATLLIAGGFFMGTTLPARDLLVREAAPPGAMGRSFGMVYSGADIGQLVGPLIYGYLLDHGQGPIVFLVAGAALFVALPTILTAWRSGGAARKPAPAE